MARTLLTTAEVAARLRTSPSTIRYWRHVGEGPPSARLGRRVVYDEGALEQWLEQRFAAERKAVS